MGFFRICQHIRRAEPILKCWNSRNVHNHHHSRKSSLWHLHCMVLGISGGGQCLPMLSIRSLVPSACLYLSRGPAMYTWRCFHFNHSFLDNFLVSSYPSTERYRQRFLFICLLNTPYRLCRIKSRTGRSCFTATNFFLCPFPDRQALSAGEEHILFY